MTTNKKVLQDKLKAALEDLTLYQKQIASLGTAMGLTKVVLGELRAEIERLPLPEEEDPTGKEPY